MSVETQGPVKPKVKEIRPIRNGAVFPVLAPEAVSETPCTRRGLVLLQPSNSINVRQRCGSGLA